VAEAVAVRAAVIGARRALVAVILISVAEAVAIRAAVISASGAVLLLLLSVAHRNG
jgi:hypothetical protein